MRFLFIVCDDYWKDILLPCTFFSFFRNVSWYNQKKNQAWFRMVSLCFWNSLLSFSLSLLLDLLTWVIWKKQSLSRCPHDHSRFATRTISEHSTFSIWWWICSLAFYQHCSALVSVLVSQCSSWLEQIRFSEVNNNFLDGNKFQNMHVIHCWLNTHGSLSLLPCVFHMLLVFVMTSSSYRGHALWIYHFDL